MAVVVVELEDGSTHRHQLVAGEPFRVGRGEGRDVDLVASTDTRLSRHAVTLTLTPHGALDVGCLQSTGTVRVYRSDGTAAAVLRRGERVLMRGAQLDVVVHSGGGPLVQLRFESDTEPALPRQPFGATLTAPRLNLYDVLQPTEGREWLTVATLAAVLTRRVKRHNPFAQPMRKELSSMCIHWWGLPSLSAGQLTSWLDKAIAGFGLEVEGDKTGVLGEYLLSNGLLGDDELDVVEQELARR